MVSLQEKQHYLRIAINAAKVGSKILMKHYGRLEQIHEKKDEGLVSIADRESEEKISEYIQVHCPGATIIGEEYGEKSGSAKSTWFIDPLDGTTNYIHQFPFFCVSIGVEVDGELIVGVIDAPELQSIYHGVSGFGAFKNGNRIQVSQRNEFKDFFFATGYTSIDPNLHHQFEVSKKLITEGRGIRRAGSAALDLCHVACGMYDLYWEKSLKSWDMAAGVVIAREAGAVVTDMFGGKFNLKSPSVLCAQPKSHKKFVEIANVLSKS